MLFQYYFVNFFFIDFFNVYAKIKIHMFKYVTKISLKYMNCSYLISMSIYTFLLCSFKYFHLLFMNVLNKCFIYKKERKGSKILSLCALWVFVCKGYHKYICQFGTIYLLNNKTMNIQY